MATLARYPRFLGKSTLFKIPPLWPFLKLAGVIPVYRTIDADAGDHNVSAFATSHTLAPAGRASWRSSPRGSATTSRRCNRSRPGPPASPSRRPTEEEPRTWSTVAVGLVYDAKARFRSRALVRVGAPAGVAQWAEAYRRDERATVRAVTEDLAAQLPRVTPTSPRGRRPNSSPASPRWSSGLPVGPVRPDVVLADQVDVAAGWPPRRTQSPASLDSSSQPSRPMSETSPSRASTTPSWRRARPPPCACRSSWAPQGRRSPCPSPPSGSLVHVVPFQIMKQVAKRPTNEGIKATVKLLGCFVLFALTYVVVGVLVGRAFGAWAGLGGRRRRAVVRLRGGAPARAGAADRRRGRGLPDCQRSAVRRGDGTGAPGRRRPEACSWCASPDGPAGNPATGPPPDGVARRARQGSRAQVGGAFGRRRRGLPWGPRRSSRGPQLTIQGG